MPDLPGPKDLVRRTHAGKYDYNPENKHYEHNEADPDRKMHKAARVRRLQERYVGKTTGKRRAALRGRTATRRYFKVGQARRTYRAMYGEPQV